MNTPPKPKDAIRYDPNRFRPKRARKRSDLDGVWSLFIEEKDIARLVGEIISTWPYVEEGMVDVLGLLLGDDTTAPRFIFRSVINQQGRIHMLRQLLANLPRNSDKPVGYDEVIDEFARLNTIRNGYMHGLWKTHQPTAKVYLSEPEGDHLFALDDRRVTKNEVVTVLRRMRLLIAKIGHGKNGLHLHLSGTPPLDPPESLLGQYGATFLPIP